MADVYVKYTPIGDGELATGIVYKENGVDKYTVSFGGIKVATPEQYDDPDIGWVDLVPSP